MSSEENKMVERQDGRLSVVSGKAESAEFKNYWDYPLSFAVGCDFGV